MAEERLGVVGRGPGIGMNSVYFLCFIRCVYGGFLCYGFGVSFHLELSVFQVSYVFYRFWRTGVGECCVWVDAEVLYGGKRVQCKKGFIKTLPVETSKL